jgi:hypothetical protein
MKIWDGKVHILARFQTVDLQAIRQKFRSSSEYLEGRSYMESLHILQHATVICD